MEQAVSVYLAPMEGVTDPALRKILTRCGGYDECYSEFIRVPNEKLPAKVLLRYVPELKQGCRTDSGTPVRIQLLGDNPELIADTAAKAVKLGAYGLDLNFGCPSRFVGHGGAMLLKEPALMREIVQRVLEVLPPEVSLTVKVRDGFASKQEAPEIIKAVAVPGVRAITVHARTRHDLYREEALDWSVIASLHQYADHIPLIANGDICSREDALNCMRIAKTRYLMIGRGALMMPNAGFTAKGLSDPFTLAQILYTVDLFIEELLRQGCIERIVLNRAKQFLGFARMHNQDLQTFFKAFCQCLNVQEARSMLNQQL